MNLAPAAPSLTSAPASATQQRLASFCSGTGAEVFHSIVYQQQIWSSDPFDVEEIHAEAREVFYRLLSRATAQPPPTSGRILLLEGVSGSGKTHLMRAFRNTAHRDESGYCGYLQMTSSVDSYARYLLNYLIDALDQPYCDPEVQESGLMRLALGLLEGLPGLSAQKRLQFQEGQVGDRHVWVSTLADRAITDPRFARCDLDLIRALLYLQVGDSKLKSRVFKWLRCEDLSSSDRDLLGGLVPRPNEAFALRTISQLGQLMSAVHGMALVLLVDQLEDTYDMEKGPSQFRRAIDTLVAIADAVPTSVVVIACLEDYFNAQKQHLPRPKLDRLERDPDPIRLASHRSLEEVESIVARRLEYLYEDQDAPFDQGQPSFPFTQAHLAPLANLRTRDVLDFCRRHRERCIRAEEWIEPETGPKPAQPSQPDPVTPPPVLPLEQTWNEFLATFKASIPEDEEAMAELLSWASRQCSEELPAGWHFGVENEGRMVPVEVHGPEYQVDKILLAVCDKDARGKGLSNQVSEAVKRSGEIPLVIVRSTAFPTSPSSKVVKQVAEVIQKGGRRVVVENADWRHMLAYRAFREEGNGVDAFTAWERESRPLSRLASLRNALGLDQLMKAKPAPVAPKVEAIPIPTPPSFTPTIQPGEGSEAALSLGKKSGLTGGPAILDPQDLTKHAAFLGGSGSGKTTAALTLIEQLLDRGVPAVLVDRKGDLCRYADPEAWQEPIQDPILAERRKRVHDRLDVALFTPGDPSGRPLTIPVVPEGMDALTTADREQLAGYAAGALGGMMGFKPRGQDQSRLAILRKAIEVLASIPGAAVTIPQIRQLVEERDPALLNAVGGFDDRQYKKLAEDLLTLWIHQQRLFAGDAERLDIDSLLGLGSFKLPGKTKLSIISTRFLPDAGTLDFWVAQLLTAVGRWIGKRPQDRLQAVFLFDEADQYLPAMRQPATKAPMENLLKRARSAGLGILLATQSPGDLDYKCRDNIGTWLIGRVKEQTALNKLKPMLSECRVDVTGKLATQETGQFYRSCPFSGAGFPEN